MPNASVSTTVMENPGLLHELPLRRVPRVELRQPSGAKVALEQLGVKRELAAPIPATC